MPCPDCEAARAEATKADSEMVLLHALLERCHAAMHGEDDTQGPLIREIEDFLLECARGNCRDAAIRAQTETRVALWRCANDNCGGHNGQTPCPVEYSPEAIRAPRPLVQTGPGPFDVVCELPTIPDSRIPNAPPSEEPVLGTCYREKRPHAFYGGEDGDINNGCIMWKPVPSPEPAREEPR